MRALIFSHELELRGFQIESLQINLIRAANGTWNFSSIGRRVGAGSAVAAVPPLSVALIEVENGRVAVATLPSQGEPIVYDHVNITVRDFSFASQFPLELSANLPGEGALSLKGKLGPHGPRLPGHRRASIPTRIARALPSAGESNAREIDKKICFSNLFEQVRFFTGDAREERLELEPACHVASDLFSGSKSGRVIDLFGSTD